MITTNLGFAEWSQVFGDEMLSHILVMNNESYRFCESMRRRNDD
ncbi:hypothetical protein [Desulforamulus ferrireducens]